MARIASIMLPNVIERPRPRDPGSGWAGGMSAVQGAIGQRERALRRLFRWSSCWPLFAMPTSLIVYVLVVLACDLALIGWELAATPIRTGDLLLFCALLAAAVICIEAMRRLGQPSGVSRDLLSAWWLPIALLLPPLYALLARPRS